MTDHERDSSRDTVEVHNRLDKVVLAVTPPGSAGATATLSPAAARRIADALRNAADAGERTPGS